MFSKKSLAIITDALRLKRGMSLHHQVKDDIDHILIDVINLNHMNAYVDCDPAYVVESMSLLNKYKEDLIRTAKTVMCSSLKQTRLNIDETLQEVLLVGYLVKCLEVSSLTQGDCEQIQRIRDDAERFELGSLSRK